MAEKNKVKFGLRNAYAFPIESEVDGLPTFGSPIRLPGAVELTLEPRGDVLEFPADDMMYYTAQNNEGYDGTLNIALLPKEFSEEILGEVSDEDFVHEFADVEGKKFALACEFQGDVKASRHMFYNCSASRPSISGTTGKTEVNTTELTFIASPIDVKGKRHVKTRTHETTSAAVYDAWFTSVQGLEKAPEGV